MKTIAGFVPRRVDISMDWVVQYMTNIDKDEVINDPGKPHKIKKIEPRISEKKY